MNAFIIILCLITSLAYSEEKGVDVSHYQESIDWEKLKNEQISFVIIKATEGSKNVDAYFEKNRLLAQKLGFITGFYHYYLNDHPPEPQAKHYLETIGKFEETNLIPIIDIEHIPKKAEKLNVSDIKKNILLWLQIIEKQTGKKPIVYINSAFARQLEFDPEWSEYPLWIAEYNKKKSPSVPKPWKEWLIWQRSAHHDFNGHYFDCDIVNETKELKDYMMNESSYSDYMMNESSYSGYMMN